MSFIPHQYSWDYWHEHERRKLYAPSTLPNKLKRGQPMLFRFFFYKFCKIAYIICNPVFEINIRNRRLPSHRRSRVEHKHNFTANTLSECSCTIFGVHTLGVTIPPVMGSSGVFSLPFPRKSQVTSTI